MKIISLLSVIAICSTPFASARLGDTPSQCVERYGEPVQKLKEGEIEDGSWAEFNMKGFKISAQFVSGKCVYLDYSKIDRKLKLSFEELKLLMIANQEAGLWRKVKNPKKNQQQWENKKFNLKATSANPFVKSSIS